MPWLDSDHEHAETELKSLADDAHTHGFCVTFDIVLHHAAGVFAYRVDGQNESPLDWQDEARDIRWRRADGMPCEDWTDGPHDPGAGNTLWPSELQHTHLFTRRGDAQSRQHGFHSPDDFSSLKGFDLDFQAEDGTPPVWDTLIRAH